MSAFIVDYNHINYLMNAALSRLNAIHFNGREVDKEYAQAIGQMLWDENRRSVDYRYTETSEQDGYELRRTHLHHFDPVQVLMSIKCLEYQSCEHPGWEGSDAQSFLRVLLSHTITSLPGYRDAKWGAPEVTR